MRERDDALRSLKAHFEQDALADAKRGDGPTRRFLPGGRVVAWLVVLVVLSAFGLLVVLVGTHAATQLSVNDAIKRFCLAEQDGNFTAAHGFLTERTGASVTPGDLADATTSANMLTCYSAQSAWYIPVNGTHATVDVWFVPAGGVTQRDLGEMTLVREHGDWHIDTIASASLNLP